MSAIRRAVDNTSGTTAVSDATIDPDVIPNPFDQVRYAPTGSTFCDSPGAGSGSYSATPLTADSLRQIHESVYLRPHTKYCYEADLDSSEPCATGDYYYYYRGRLRFFRTSSGCACKPRLWYPEIKRKAVCNDVHSRASG